LVLCYKTFDDVKKRKFKKELLKAEDKIAATMILINKAVDDSCIHALYLVIFLFLKYSFHFT